MKKCPKCKAGIHENARFCLYCMTSFEDKQTIENKNENTNNKKRWLCLVAIVLVFALLIYGVVALKGNGNKKTSSAGGDTKTGTTYDGTSVDNSIGDDTNASQFFNGESNITETVSSSNVSTTVLNYPHKETDTELNNSFINPIPEKETTKTSVPMFDDKPIKAPSAGEIEENNKVSESVLSTTVPQESTAKYIYRDAKYGDDYSVRADIDNCIVITGVKTPSSNGEYRIPEKIDGKKVVAIMGYAFCGEGIKDTVKKVFVPACVKNIWNYAFAECRNLTDIYFLGDSIYTESLAFPDKSKQNGTLTIHCSSNCSDRNFRYYKNSASNYDAQYEEWNG